MSSILPSPLAIVLILAVVAPIVEPLNQGPTVDILSESQAHVGDDAGLHDDALQTTEVSFRSDVDLASVSERPLFSATRLPVLPYQEPQREEPDPILAVPVEEPETSLVEEDAEPPPPVPTDTEYLGFVIDGTATRALIRNVRSGDDRWLSVGDELQGWRLSGIFDTSLEFIWEDERYILERF